MEATKKDLWDPLADAARTYFEAQTAVEEAENDLLTAREDLKIIFEQYEADGITPEELEETLGKYGLSYEEISNWE